MPEFLLRPDVVFLNHGSFGATPKGVLEAQREWQSRMEAQPVDFMVRQLEPALRTALSTAAAYVGTSAGNLSFVPNATTGVNAVIQQAKLRDGDEILTTSHRYDAVGNALHHVAELRGAKVVEAHLPFPVEDGEILERVEAAISPRTRLMVVDQIASATAIGFPAEALVEMAKKRDIPILIDGAHAPGQVDVDLDILEPDYWTGNLHKWTCSPKGAALLYVAPRHQSTFHAHVISHGYRTGWQREFGWVGTMDFSAYLASTAAIAMHEEWGGERFRAQNHALMIQASELILSTFPNLPACAGKPTLAMRSFLLQGVAAEPLYAALQQAGIETVVHPWGSDSLLRISCFSRYNTLEQYVALVDALRRSNLMP